MDHRKWIACVTGRRGATPLGRRMGAEMDAWVYRLNDGNDTGFYRTGPARAPPSSFTWQGKFCQDCPFWLYEMRQVFAERRSAMAHIRVYFDPWNRDQARRILAERERRDFGDGKEWLRDRSRAGDQSSIREFPS